MIFSINHIFYAALVLMSLSVILTVISTIQLIAGFRSKGKDERNTWRDKPPPIFRIFFPVIMLFSSNLRLLMSEKYLVSLKNRLSAAGLNYSIMPEEFFSIKIILCFMSILGLIGVITLSTNAGSEILIFMFVFSIVSFFYPDIWLTDRISERRRLVAKDFPFLLDLLVLSMKAGLNYSTSLAQAVTNLPNGPVREEFAKLLREIRAGKIRRDALNDLAKRMNVNLVHNFVAALNQGEETGGEVVGVLTAQAEQRRTERFNLAEELANKAPVKILFPMVAFLFPIFFMLIGFVIIVKMAEIEALPDTLAVLLLGT